MNDIIVKATDSAKQLVLPYALNLFNEDYLVNEAIKYSLSNCGKMLRPAFVFETAKLLGVKKDDNLVKLATAIELIHTYSLIHDDLPCMDNDDFRRNKPSCHKVFGEGIATLAGDGLLNMAFEVLLSGDIIPNYIEAARYMAKCSGVSGMIGGQSDDINISPDISIDKLTSIINNKTCRLFSASILAAAVYCKATDIELRKLSSYANYFGVAFQLRDDLQDINKTNEGEINLASKLGIEQSKALLNDCINKALDSISDFESNDFVLAVLNFLKEGE